MSPEDGSDIVDRLFVEADAEFVISDISIIEFYSALSLKVDEKFCKVITLEGLPVINPIIGDNL